VRVTTAFSRLVRMPEAWVRKVRFEPDRVIVEVALRRRRLICPECGYSTAARKDTRPEKSVWRHLDLGVWRLEIRCRRRRLWCPEHGARTEGVPFARPGSEFTRDFERLVAWLATRTDKSTIKRVLRIDWDTVGRIIKRVCDDELDPDRLNDLFDIGIDEVSWKKQHNYLTLVADHRRGKIVWGTAGKGEQAADSFFAELDSPPDHRSERATQPRRATEPAIMVPFGPCPTVPAGHGIQGAWLQDGLEIEPAIFARAAKLEAISLDMGPGYAKSARNHASQAVICIDPYHVVQLANQALDEVRRDYWNELRSLGDQDAAKRFKDARWSLLKKPDKLTEEQADTLARLKAAGGEVWRAHMLKGSRPRHLRARALARGRHPLDRPAAVPPGPQPTSAVRAPRPDDPQTPRRDPRRHPPRHQPRPHRSAQQQGPPHHPLRPWLSLCQSRARARAAHLRPPHPSPPARTTRARDHVTPTTSMPREPLLASMDCS